MNNPIPGQSGRIAERLAAGDELMTSTEVSRTFQVHPKTVARWSEDGKIEAVRTPGGHRRYWKSEVVAILAGLAGEPA